MIMSEKQDGGPAFPCDAAPVHPADIARIRAHMGWGIDQARRFLSAHPGMSLRDWLAGQALPGVIVACAQDTLFDGETPEAHFASRAFSIADAMLAARAKP
jgi:hypothetical protein